MCNVDGLGNFFFSPEPVSNEVCISEMNAGWNELVNADANKDGWL